MSSRFYIRNPITGHSGTREWVERFFNMFFLGNGDVGEGFVTPHYDRLYSTTSPPKEVIFETLDVHKRTRKLEGTTFYPSDQFAGEPHHALGLHTYIRSTARNPIENLLCQKIDVQRIAKTLPKRSRYVLGMKYVGDMTDAEIAVELEVSESTVLRIVNHALDTIAKRLDR